MTSDLLYSVRIEWQPYFLDPTAPPEGEDLMEHLKGKYGAEMVARFSAPGNPLDVAGEKVGIKFNSSRRFINTINGHRLMEWCNNAHPESADTLMDKLFHAYFVEARDLSKKEQLVEIAQSAGLNGTDVAEFLETDKYKDDVLQFYQKARTQLRVTGVPYFIIENNNGGRPTAFSGAQVRSMLFSLSILIYGDGLFFLFVSLLT